MSEELIQRNLYKAPEKMGVWSYYNIGATSLKALKAAKIIPDRDYAEFEDKKPDALIIKKPQIIAAIEFKKPSQLKTQKHIAAAISQEIGTALALGAKIYIVTDGQKTFWINPLTGNEVTTDKGEPIALNFSKDDPECVALITKAIASLSAANDVLLAAKDVDPLPLARKVWQDLWQATGAAPENCLYTFVEIFIFKYLSDLGVLSGSDSFYDLIGRYNKDSDERVLQIYADTIRKNIKDKFPRSEIDDTTIINGTLFVTKENVAVEGYATVFKRILERFRDFGTLEKINYDFKSKLFETFLKESISKKNWGQYFTPLKVVRAIVSMADVRPNIKVCDPACGVGKFLLEPILHDTQRFFKVDDGKLIPQITLSGFDKGFDKDEQKTIILAKANMLIYLSSMIRENSGITRQFAEQFNKTFLLQTNSILGTLARPEVDEYDLILTNPPYVMSGSSNLKDEIGKRTPEETAGKQKSLLEQHYAINAMGVEGLFMEWIVRALKPSGKAFVVVPDGIMNRSNDKRLRDFILAESDVDAIISLPINTFFTTNKKTYIIALTKKEVTLIDGVQTKARQTTPVFTYLCSEIGETRDTYRFDMEQNDLENAAQLFNMVKGVKNNIVAVQKLCESDRRCKVVSIDELYNGSHWSVERWWTREERIDLGVEDVVESVSIEELGALVGDIANTLLEYKDLFAGLQKKKDELTYGLISLTDNAHFELVSSGIGQSRTQLQSIDTQTSTDVPVYTAAKLPVAYVKPIQGKALVKATVEQPIISFATNGDGSAGRNFIVHTSPFYLNVDRMAVAIKNPRLLPIYVYSQISDMRDKYKFSHSFKANRHNLKIVEVLVPITKAGEFDVEQQREIVAQFELVNHMRDDIRRSRDLLSDMSVSVMPSDAAVTFVKLSDKALFELNIGKRILHKDYRVAKGTIPIYSANVFEPFAYSDISNISDFSSPYVLWGIDGNFNFNCIKRGVPFGTTDHCGSLKILDNRLLPEYIAYALELAKHKYGFDRGLRASLRNMYKVEIPVPIDSSGKFDIALQQTIAEQYVAISLYKGEILDKIDALVEQRISY